MSLFDIREVERSSTGGVLKRLKASFRQVSLAVNAYLPLLFLAGLYLLAAPLVAQPCCSFRLLDELTTILIPLWLAMSAVLVIMLGMSLFSACLTHACFKRTGMSLSFAFFKQWTAYFDFLNRWVQMTLILGLAGMTMAAGMIMGENDVSLGFSTGAGDRALWQASHVAWVSHGEMETLHGKDGMMQTLVSAHDKAWLTMLMGTLAFFALRRGFCPFKVRFLSAFLLVWLIGSSLGHPSMPVALATLVAIVAWTLSRFVGFVMWGLVVVVMTGAVAAGKDAGDAVAAGLIIAFSAWWLAEPMTRRIVIRKPALLYRIMLRNREALRLH